MTLTLWLTLLLTLLLNTEAITLTHSGGEQDEENVDDEEAGSGDSGEPVTDTAANINSTQGVAGRRDASSEYNKDWDSMKGPWLRDLMKGQTFILATTKSLGMTNKSQQELNMTYSTLNEKIKSKFELGVKKELAAVKIFGPPGPPPTDAEQYSKLMTVTNVFTTKGPLFFEQAQKGEGVKAASTMCAIISGVAAVIPNPIGMVTSFIFNIASFFINFGAKKAAASKKNPYAGIYKKIDQAVKTITKGQRKIEMARMKAGLATAQDISERFLGLGGERFTLDEFHNWAWTNNVPGMDSFVDPMAIVQSYMETLPEEVFTDTAGKLLTTLYVNIAVIRDIVLTAVNLLFPLDTIETPAPTPGEPDEAEHASELKDFCPLKRLRASYQDSLNRQKKKTFDYLLQFHRPNSSASLKQVRYNNWYYLDNDEDVEMIRSYLDGLSYVAEDGGVRLMQRVVLHDEVLRKARCSIVFETKALTGDCKTKGECDYAPKKAEFGFLLKFTAASGVDSTQRYFTFLPAGSYTYKKPEGQIQNFTVTPGFTRIKFHDESFSDSGDWHDVVNINDRGYFVTRYKTHETYIHLYILSNGYKIKDKHGSEHNDLDRYFYEKDNGHLYKEFKILLTNPDIEENSDELEILVMSPSEEGEYLGRTDEPEFFGIKWDNFVRFTQAYTLKIHNLAEVKAHLKDTFKGPGEPGDIFEEQLGEVGEETKVNLGNSFRSVNEALHYCQLVGRCTQKISSSR